MIATIVHVKVKKEHIEAFIRATVKNHEKSVKENGNMRFDVLQKEDDPSQFALYEAYASEELAAAHKHTPHYLEWRETVADWMAEPREGVRYNAIKP
jgi:autoinducer 2-degrading protein